MKYIALATILIFAWVSDCMAQSKPTDNCFFADDGFATTAGEKVQIAEIAQQAALQLQQCGTAKGCVQVPVALGAPVQIYRRQGEWTCGYVFGQNGAGPAWIRTAALRVVPYDEQPPLNAWMGIWTGGEDRVLIRAGSAPGTLQLEGSARWRGKYATHFCDTKGSASPKGNHLHFVEGGADSCTIDLTLLSRYILASDNQSCGGMNVRFEGIWKRTRP
jgi:hypothetical protein